MKDFDLRLYLVLDPDLCGPFGMVATAEAAVRGGATMVQLRHKMASTADLVDIGRQLKKVMSGTDVKFIVNDDVEAALAIDADGVHIGQEDGHPAAARMRIGPHKILGVSVETVALAAEVDPAVVDYVGIGPVFSTATKPDHKQPIGMDGLAAIVAASPVPSVAIGGLKAEHARQVLVAGAQGMAVVSAVCGQPDPYEATVKLREALAASGTDGIPV